MYNQPEAILEQYDLEINQISKGRGAYIVNTNQGMKTLVPFRGSRERALFLGSILDELNANGYPVERITFTKEGEPLAEDETGVRYWLKTLISGSECQTGRETDMRQAVRQLAFFHETVAKSRIPVPDFMMGDRNAPHNLYERHYRELIKVKNYVKTRKTKNAFERRFQEQYPRYIEDAGRALQLLAGQKDSCRRILCHGDVSQHSIIRTPEGFRMIHFENMCYNLAVSDLAKFLRKMLEKNNWSCELGMRLIEEYGQVRTLSGDELKQLYVILLFPEKFWKISNHYVNSHKAWVCERDIEKLEHMVRQENARTLFLENLFSIT